MNKTRLAASLAFLLLPCSLFAQGKPDASYFDDADGPQQSFALVVQSFVVTMNGGWHPTAGLARYTHDHAGTYIVFAQGGELRRLDAAEALAEAQRLYAPMHDLATKQEALAAEQRPLAAQQGVLAAQQRAATNPQEMTRIGAEQAALGQQQGDIGRLQGAIGQKQGEIGRAFYKRVQGMLTACMANGSCPPVAAEAARQ